MVKSDIIDVGIGDTKYCMKRTSRSIINKFVNDLNINEIMLSHYQYKLVDFMSTSGNNSNYSDSQIESIYDFVIERHPELEFGSVLLDIKDKLDSTIDMHMIEAFRSTKQSDYLDQMGDHLKERIIGQDEHIDEIVNSIIAKSMGISADSKPRSFLILGKSGVGKTETVNLLSQYMEVEDMRIPCEHYQESHSISKLLGSPPGYLGSDKGSSLAKFISKNPKGILLFDEIEKANPSLFKILYNLMEGNFADNHNNKCGFDGYIFFTSNIGNDFASNFSQVGFNSANPEDLRKDNIESELKKYFDPPFLGRMNKKLFYNDLGEDDYSRIIESYICAKDIELKKMGFNIVIEESYFNHLLEKSSNPDYGVRLIKQSFETDVLERVALLKRAKPKKRTFNIGYNNGSLKVR